MGIVIRSDFRTAVDRIATRYGDVCAQIWRTSAHYRYGLDSDTVASAVGYDFSYAGNGKIRYVPANRVQAYRDALPQDIFDIDATDAAYARFSQTAKAGKLTRALLKVGASVAEQDTSRFCPYRACSAVTDAEVESFVNRLKATDGQVTDRWLLVDGDDIPFWYDGDRYDDMRDIGTLARSCMRYDYANEYLSVYADNPKSVMMLAWVNTDTDTLLARALLWRGTNEHGRTVYALDRVYGSDAAQVKAKELALSLGAYVATYSREGVYTNSTGDAFNSLTVRLSVDAMSYDTMPYMDTMSYLNYSENTLSNDGRNGYDCQLTGTGGNDHYGFHEQHACCEGCGDSYRESDMHSTDDGLLCYECYRDGRCIDCAEYVGPDNLCDALCEDCYTESHCLECNALLSYSQRVNGGICEDCYTACHCRSCGYETRHLDTDGLCDECAEDAATALSAAQVWQQSSHCWDCHIRLTSATRHGVTSQCHDCYTACHCQHCGSALPNVSTPSGNRRGECTRCVPPVLCACGHAAQPNDTRCVHCSARHQIAHGQQTLRHLAWHSTNDGVSIGTVLAVSELLPWYF